MPPWAMTSMILAYLDATKEMTPDRGWEEKIASLSKKFREIQEKALAPAPASAPLSNPA